MSPPQSSAAASSAADPAADALLSAVQKLAEEKVLGLIWADDRLAILANFGPLVETMSPGRYLPDALIALLGYEAELQELRRTGASLQLPNLTLSLPGAVPGRFNLSAYWIGEDSRLLILISRVLSELEFEYQLHQQVRLRQIAEEKIAAQARQLEVANAELTRVNRELDQFAYVLSHDLKAPLRAMRLLARDIESAVSSDDSVAVTSVAAEIRRQSLRMSTMMSGLYEYTRIGRSELVDEQIDSRRLVQSIVASFPPRPGFEIRVTGDWPTLRTSEAPLDLVLRNLIENALKHHDATSGTIEVCGADLTSELVLTITDDGPGIHEGQRQSIFEPFVQLQGQDPTEGYGMGLALVKKAVERMGGAISVMDRAAGERGVQFKVIWPKGR